MTIRIRSDLFSDENVYEKMPTNIQEEAMIFKIQQKMLANQERPRCPQKKKKIMPRKAQDIGGNTSCRICDKKMITSSISSHMRVVHCLTLSEYKMIYGDFYHHCKICGESMLHEAIEISKHLRRNKHGLSFKEYNTKYIKGHRISLKVEQHLMTPQPDHSREEIQIEENLDEITEQQLLYKIDLLLDEIL